MEPFSDRKGRPDEVVRKSEHRRIGTVIDMARNQTVCGHACRRGMAAL